MELSDAQHKQCQVQFTQRQRRKKEEGGEKSKQGHLQVSAYLKLLVKEQGIYSSGAQYLSGKRRALSSIPNTKNSPKNYKLNDTGQKVVKRLPPLGHPLQKSVPNKSLRKPHYCGTVPYFTSFVKILTSRNSYQFPLVFTVYPGASTVGGRKLSLRCGNVRLVSLLCKSLERQMEGDI